MPPQDTRFDPVKFVDTINSRARPRPDSSFQQESDKNANLQWFSDFTDCRPTAENMELTANEIDTNITHGHNGRINITSGKVNGLNPRTDDGLYTVVAVRNGVPDSTTNVTTNNRKHKLDDSIAANHVQENIKRKCIETAHHDKQQSI